MDKIINSPETSREPTQPPINIGGNSNQQGLFFKNPALSSNENSANISNTSSKYIREQKSRRKKALLVQRILDALRENPMSILQLSKKVKIPYAKCYAIIEKLDFARAIAKTKRYDPIKRENFNVWFTPELTSEEKMILDAKPFVEGKK